ncbi:MULTISPECIES: flagellar hook protein FlgE [Roseobacteraceae]|mgnify:FL=1|uniref:Flagellar hook protein FlgE n=1 Tax=Celeribacter baekdonensis B30 TaxID=1208323 RepID=K2JHE9_9RHOB|nr:MULTISPECIES: flagellar hook protein FlgE [Roseobacteraceae]EKE74588.1 flagellar hook protein FlgE [Celeribacter baekdonensis B30]KAB6714625.1 flagellar hook protein FlgE [Roseobacter sp. TSBP12]|tara:strand:+ start:14013 stop:15308 length:1296 start_codon:yes stop_codon:yes gene_type:complete
MSISSSLNAGVAGLAANATRLATISDNIANSGTYGYKRAEADFQSFVITNSNNSGTYSAGGVRASTNRLIGEQGSLVSTSNATDIAISGNGFIPVTTEVSIDGSMGDQPLMMTTTGSFYTDADGILKTDSGLVLLGWPADADGTIATYARDTMTGLEPVVINSNQTAGDPTTKINLGVNLPAEDATEVLPLSVEYFGNLGTSESLNVTFTPDAVAPNTWVMSITDSASAGAIIGEYTIVFDDSRGSGGTLSTVTPTVNNPATATYNATDGTLALTVDGGPLEMTIGKPGDTNGLTQLSDTFAPTSITKDGSPVGNLTSVEIADNGYVTATYDTGFTRTIYQIPLVDVPNANGLTSLGNQTYQVSPDSGSFFLWDAGDGPTGTIEGFAREGSTTDVAAELTDLIQTQRAYSSNAKVIQTVDEMLQETTNIKR